MLRPSWEPVTYLESPDSPCQFGVHPRRTSRKRWEQAGTSRNKREQAGKIGNKQEQMGTRGNKRANELEALNN